MAKQIKLIQERPNTGVNWFDAADEFKNLKWISKLDEPKNELISMDGSNFNLFSKNAVDLTDEVITLVSKMYFGKKEYKEFKKLNKK